MNNGMLRGMGCCSLFSAIGWQWFQLAWVSLVVQKWLRMQKLCLSAMAIFCLSISLAVSQEAEAEAEVRTWMDNTGQHSTRASFDRVEGTRVILLKDGEVIELEMSKLSAADQKYVKDYVEAFGGGNMELDGASTADVEETGEGGGEGETREEPMVADAELEEGGVEESESAQEGGASIAGAGEELSPWERIMDNKGSILFAVVLIGGIGLFVLGELLFLVGAFSESVGWGLACLFLPIVPLVFIFCHWDRARAGVIVSLLGLAVLLGGGVVLAEMSPSPEEARDAMKEGAVDGFRAGTGLD